MELIIEVVVEADDNDDAMLIVKYFRESNDVPGEVISVTLDGKKIWGESIVNGTNDEVKK